MKVNPNNGSSPHTRGAHVSIVGYVYHARIIPAYAGSTRLASLLRVKPRGSSPHTRGAPAEASGEDRDDRIIPAYAGSTSPFRIGPGPFPGSSPHTRGAPTTHEGDSPSPRIIPAYAGSTPSGTTLKAISPDHPRIRGEHLWRNSNVLTEIGSSPHTRGARLPLGAPAWAAVDHPRIRGEHVGWAWEGVKLVGSSPHTRGALSSRSFGFRL